MIGLSHSAAYWTSNNPTLSLNQIGQERDTNAIKIGDGVTVWNDLPYRDQPVSYSGASGTNTYVSQNVFGNVSGLYEGLKVRIKFTNANTGASTLNIGFGATPIKKNGNQDLQNLDIIPNGIYDLTFDGTNWQIVINTAL